MTPEREPTPPEGGAGSERCGATQTEFSPALPTCMHFRRYSERTPQLVTLTCQTCGASGSIPRCVGFATTTGRQCKCFARENHATCWTHDPERLLEAAEARARRAAHIAEARRMRAAARNAARTAAGAT